MTPSRARGLVLFVAVAAYLNSVGNGFAYDDNSVIPLNDVVTEAQWDEALFGRYWRDAREGSGLYRPVTVTSFTAEWGLWRGSPLGFHATSVVVHAGVCLLLLSVLLLLCPVLPALAGSLFFAIHPVHVEAVANVVGRSELYAGAAVLTACIVYLRGATWSPAGRALRLAVLALLYLIGLGSKEIAVTLPAVLVLLEVVRTSDVGLGTRLRREAPVLVSLVAVFAAYMMLRISILGTATGEVAAPALRGISGGERLLTALSVWPQYLRLMVFPRVLAADYAPGVLQIPQGMAPGVLLGAAVLLAAMVGTVALRKTAPLVSLGLAWFLVTILPVSNLVIPSGVLVAERTLYLPSVGAAMIVAGLALLVFEKAPDRQLRLLGGLAAVVALALFVRTVMRNPTWLSSYTVLNTLAMEHPESYMALQHRAAGLVRVGEMEDAARNYDAAVALNPRHYGLLTEAGGFHARMRNDGRAETLLRQAVEVTPDQPTAYRLLAEMLIRQGRGQLGHATALQGLSRAGPDRELWALVSEAYIAKGDLEASVRARHAALAQDPGSVHDLGRLADLYEAMGRTPEASDARARAARLESGGEPGEGGE